MTGLLLITPIPGSNPTTSKGIPMHSKMRGGGLITITVFDATDAACGRNPLHVGALMATAVVSAFVLLMAAASVAHAAAVEHAEHARTGQSGSAA
jgi:hypothetical protein